MTMIRKTRFTFLLLTTMVIFCSVGILAASQEGASDTTKDMPKAVFPDTRYDFGSVMEGTQIKHDFIIENHGTTPLVIKNVRPD